MRTRLAALALLALGMAIAGAAQAPMEPAAQLEHDLVAKYGEPQRARAHRGIAQVAALWRAEDGDAKAFAGFVRESFAGDQATLDAMFLRYQHNMEVILGHAHEIHRTLLEPSELDGGPIAAYDEVFAGWDPNAHLLDDLFENKLAFTALLNFPLTSLAERTTQGAHWSRRQWAETQLAEYFRQRVPAAARQAAAESFAAGNRYIAGYNIWMHHLVDARGQRLFPPGKRLLTHWNLRDELKADYADRKDGLAKQRAIQRVMERIVAQDIPAIVIDNPTVDWNPYTNAVTRSTVNDAPAGSPPHAEPPPGPINAAREDDERYARMLANFHAQQQIDRFSPGQNTRILRSFERERQLSEQRVQAMLEQVLGSPLVARTAKVISKRLGRKLEPFDIWYNGFRASDKQDEAQLDVIVAGKYPDAAAYQRDIPADTATAGFRCRSRRLRCAAHRGRARARLRTGHWRRDAWRTRAPADAGGARRHELQGLQHRRPRDVPQRRADLLAL